MVLRLALLSGLACGLAIAAEQSFPNVPYVPLTQPPISLQQGTQRALMNAIRPAPADPQRRYAIAGPVKVAPATPRVCSIPLKEYRPPANTKYVIGELKIPGNSFDHIAMSAPAPPCRSERAEAK